MSCFRCGFMIQTCVSKRFEDLLRFGVLVVQVLTFTVSFVQGRSTDQSTERSTDPGTSRPTLAFFPVLILVCLLVSPFVLLVSLDVFPHYAILVLHGDGE